MCDELRLTIQEVEKCASTAIQIASGKLKTRGSGGIDVEELRDFLRQVDSLPCKLPEADKLQVLTHLLLKFMHAHHTATITFTSLFSLSRRDSVKWKPSREMLCQSWPRSISMLTATSLIPLPTWRSFYSGENSYRSVCLR